MLPQYQSNCLTNSDTTSECSHLQCACEDVCTFILKITVLASFITSCIPSLLSFFISAH